MWVCWFFIVELGFLVGLFNIYFNTGITFNSDYTYHSNPATPFTVNANTTFRPTASNFFYKLQFTIQAPADNQVASLTASLGYRFLAGDMSLLLEPGNGDAYCNSFFSPDEACVYGSNDYDRQSLHQLLRNGAYTLWIYEPIVQNTSLSTCSPFDFSLTVKFLSEDEDVFSCEGTPVPSSLDIVKYLSPSGTIHFVDDFLINGENPYSTFVVKETSLLRVAVLSRYESDLSLRVVNQANQVAYTSPAGEPSLFQTLDAGVYHIYFQSNLISASGCPLALVEFALEPVTIVPSANCTGRSTTPTLPQSITVPYYYGPTGTQNPDVFYAHYGVNNVVAEYSFAVTQTSVFEAAVSSDFLRGDLRLVLTRGGVPFGVGFHDYNMCIHH